MASYLIQQLGAKNLHPLALVQQDLIFAKMVVKQSLHPLLLKSEEHCARAYKLSLTKAWDLNMRGCSSGASCTNWDTTSTGLDEVVFSFILIMAKPLLSGTPKKLVSE